MKRIWDEDPPFEPMRDEMEEDLYFTLLEGENGPEGWKFSGILGAILRLIGRKVNKP